MKKYLLIIVAILCSGIIFHENVQAQCTPDLSLTSPGIYPDSATGLPSGIINQAYSEVIQVRVLTDTTYIGLPAIIANITITGVTGLPPGLTYSCNPANCIFGGGTNGCILLSGTPQAVGNFPLNVTLMVNGTLAGSPLSLPQTVGYYSITIGTGTGLNNNISSVKFEMLPAIPNPAIDYTDVVFTTPVAGDFKLKIYNMIGKEVTKQTVRAMPGTNSTRVKLNEFTPGVYMLSMENGNAILTKRLIVSRK